jgi:hypothetical protein
MLDSQPDLPFEMAMDAAFRYQSVSNALYEQFIDLTGGRARHAFYPCLPIQCFKTHNVQSGDWTPETWFTSSGTTGQQNSRHPVRYLESYLHNALAGFAQFYGNPSNWVIIALLPSYLERNGSSLVAMADALIKKSGYPESGFFLDDFEHLKSTLIHCKTNNYPTILLGVSFALLDFAHYSPMDLSGMIIMETGGMKGRRKELTRTELHRMLQKAFSVEKVHSEYGMTELFSQAYTKGGTIYYPSRTMKVFATEINDPFCLVEPGKTGVLNVVDLANIDTCSFIQTEDIARVFADGSFEMLGRLDAAELRGCNLMIE